MSYFDDNEGPITKLKVRYVCPKCGRRMTARAEFPVCEKRCLAAVPCPQPRPKGSPRKVACNAVMIMEKR